MRLLSFAFEYVSIRVGCTPLVLVELFPFMHVWSCSSKRKWLKNKIRSWCKGYSWSLWSSVVCSWWGGWGRGVDFWNYHLNNVCTWHTVTCVCVTCLHFGLIAALLCGQGVTEVWRKPRGAGNDVLKEGWQQQFSYWRHQDFCMLGDTRGAAEIRKSDAGLGGWRVERLL